MRVSNISTPLLHHHPRRETSKSKTNQPPHVFPILYFRVLNDLRIGIADSAFVLFLGTFLFHILSWSVLLWNLLCCSLLCISICKWSSEDKTGPMVLLIATTSPILVFHASSRYDREEGCWRSSSSSFLLPIYHTTYSFLSSASSSRKLMCLVGQTACIKEQTVFISIFLLVFIHPCLHLGREERQYEDWV